MNIFIIAKDKLNSYYEMLEKLLQWSKFPRMLWTEVSNFIFHFNNFCAKKKLNIIIFTNTLAYFDAQLNMTKDEDEEFQLKICRLPNIQNKPPFADTILTFFFIFCVLPLGKGRGILCEFLRKEERLCWVEGEIHLFRDDHLHRQGWAKAKFIPPILAKCKQVFLKSNSSRWTSRCFRIKRSGSCERCPRKTLRSLSAKSWSRRTHGRSTPGKSCRSGKK